MTTKEEEKVKLIICDCCHLSKQMTGDNYSNCISCDRIFCERCMCITNNSFMYNLTNLCVICINPKLIPSHKCGERYRKIHAHNKNESNIYFKIHGDKEKKSDSNIYFKNQNIDYGKLVHYHRKHVIDNIVGKYLHSSRIYSHSEIFGDSNDDDNNNNNNNNNNCNDKKRKLDTIDNNNNGDEIPKRKISIPTVLSKKDQQLFDDIYYSKK